MLKSGKVYRQTDRGTGMRMTEKCDQKSSLRSNVKVSCKENTAEIRYSLNHEEKVKPEVFLQMFISYTDNNVQHNA